MAQAQSRTAEEKVALITGASGGIGLAAGLALIRAGYRVFGTSRQAAPDEVRQGIHMLRCDVTDDQSVKQLIKDVVGLAGRIDVLVNNAGRSLIGAAEESSLDQAHSLFDINVFGILRTTTEVLPIMRKQGQGRIINISSVAGFLPGPYTALYNATKHAVEGYSESLDHERRTFGIRVSLVEPVFTRTALEENGDKPDRILSVYDKGRAAMNATWRNGIAAGDPVEAVADKVVQAATEKQPSIRYTPGKMAGRLRLMRRFVPEKTFEKSFRKQMGVRYSSDRQASRHVSFTEERPMKYYLCKYIPPRADFLATMTADEKAWMKQHGAFLDDLLEKGQVVAHGPVMDPSGGYGVSLYQIADDQDIKAITS